MPRTVRYTGRATKSVPDVPGLVRTGGEYHVSDGVAGELVDRDDFEIATCETVKDDGETCGRERPCRYHD